MRTAKIRATLFGGKNPNEIGYRGRPGMSLTVRNDDGSVLENYIFLHKSFKIGANVNGVFEKDRYDHYLKQGWKDYGNGNVGTWVTESDFAKSKEDQNSIKLF